MRQNLGNTNWILVATAWLLTVSLAPAGDGWLHVRVEDHETDGAGVKIDLPLRVAQSWTPQLVAEHLDIEDWNPSGFDPRALLDALRDAPAGDFVTIRGTDESLRVAKQEDSLILHIEDRGSGGQETVRVEMPTEVLAALFSGKSGELDLAAALSVLSRKGRRELIRVETREVEIRVWVDSDEFGH